MSKFGDVLNNIIIRQASGDNPYNRIFVVSAYSNVTNWLLEHKKSGEPGVYDLFEKSLDYGAALDRVLERLITINQGLEEVRQENHVAMVKLVAQLVMAEVRLFQYERAD